jgi:hypothetical protein
MSGYRRLALIASAGYPTTMLDFLTLALRETAKKSLQIYGAARVAELHPLTTPAGLRRAEHDAQKASVAIGDAFDRLVPPRR